MCAHFDQQELHKVMEKEVTTVIGQQLQVFQEENLPVADCIVSGNSTAVSSFTSALTRSHSIQHKG